jgi:hypothetical protein
MLQYWAPNKSLFQMVFYCPVVVLIMGRAGWLVKLRADKTLGFQTQVLSNNNSYKVAGEGL